MGFLMPDTRRAYWQASGVRAGDLDRCRYRRLHRRHVAATIVRSASPGAESALSEALRFGRHEIRPAQRALRRDGALVALGARAFDLLIERGPCALLRGMSAQGSRRET